MKGSKAAFEKNITSASHKDFNMHIEAKDYDSNACCSWFKSILTIYNILTYNNYAILIYM